MTIPELIQSAGPLLWVLTLLSVYTVYLAAMIHQRQRSAGRDPRQIHQDVHHALMTAGNVTAGRVLNGNPSAAAQVMAAGLHRAPAGTDNVIAGMNAESLTQEAHLTRGLNHLSTVAQLAPLLGLLGTVFGMVRSFLVFSQTAAPTPTQLATGISEALINTAGGLIVAIAAYALRNALRAQADQVLSDVDRSRELLIAWLDERQLSLNTRVGPIPALPSLLHADPVSEPDTTA